MSMELQEIITLIKKTKTFVENRERAAHIKVKGPAEAVVKNIKREVNMQYKIIGDTMPERDLFCRHRISMNSRDGSFGWYRQDNGIETVLEDIFRRNSGNILFCVAIRILGNTCIYCIFKVY